MSLAAICTAIECDNHIQMLVTTITQPKIETWLYVTKKKLSSIHSFEIFFLN